MVLPKILELFHRRNVRSIVIFTKIILSFKSEFNYINESFNIIRGVNKIRKKIYSVICLFSTLQMCLYDMLVMFEYLFLLESVFSVICE